MLFLKKLREFPFYPLLILPFMTLYYMAENSEDIAINFAYRPVIIGIFLGLFVLSVWFLVLRNIHSAALLTTFIFMGFYLYGFIYSLIEKGILRFNFSFHHLHRYLVLLFCFSLISLGLFLYNRRDRSKNWSKNIQILVYSLLFFQITRIAYRSQSILKNTHIYSSPNITLTNNIYYFILDGYAHANTLHKFYDYDNMAFINKMITMGFQYQDSFYANYYHTRESLGSTLNMNISLAHQLRENILFRLLKTYGYKVHTIGSGYAVTEQLQNIDYHYQPCGLNELERLLLQSKILHLENFLKSDNAEFVLNQLEMMENIAFPPKSSQFLFTHLVFPHPPYILDSVGKITKHYPMTVRSWEPQSAYIDQIIYLNKRLHQITSNILSKDSTAIIYIQSDHGPYLKELSIEDQFQARAQILSLIRFPQNIHVSYSNIHSSVNTFIPLINLLDSMVRYPIQKDSFAGKSSFVNNLSIFEER